MKTALLDGEEVMAEELANLFRRWEGVGGRLYVTDRRLIFEPHPLNFQRAVAVVPLEDIEDVGPRNNLGFIPNGMEVRTRGGARYRFVVWGRDRLIDMIHVCKGLAVGGEPREKAPGPRTAPADAAIRPGSSVDGTAPETDH